MIRVGFLLSYTDSGWLGGINYLSNLLHAVAKVPDRQIEPVLVVPPDAPAKLLAGFPEGPVLRSALSDRRHRAWSIARQVAQRGFGRDLLMERFLRQHNIQVLSHSGLMGARSSVRTIGWIPDFQHLHMPEFFKPSELTARAAGYGRAARQCSTVLLSSVDAQRDLAGFAPDAVAHSRVLHFVSGFGGGAMPVADEAALRERYGLIGPYFHLPNQFWAHKNHRVVIDALALLKAQGQPLRVVCTGHTQDARQPAYFAELMQHAEQQGVADSFQVLGLVPYADLAGLMQHSVAVINPSLFEGWSTSVEESKSLGLTVVLSDVNVHREQAPARGVFFEARNPHSLADALTGVLARYAPAAEQAHRARAKAELPSRFAAFGADYQQVVLETCARR